MGLWAGGTVRSLVVLEKKYIEEKGTRFGRVKFVDELCSSSPPLKSHLGGGLWKYKRHTQIIDVFPPSVCGA